MSNIKPRWPIGSDVDGYTVTNVYACGHNLTYSKLRYVLKCNTCGNDRSWWADFVSRHLRGTDPIVCTKCVPLSERRRAPSVPRRRASAGRIDPNRVPSRKCKHCAGLGSRSRQPALPCECPMPREHIADKLSLSSNARMVDGATPW
jgi:hypothetical protein